MTRDELEFMISQHIDGDLSVADEQRLAARLADDAGAREMLAQYRALDSTLKSRRRMPSIELADLSAAIHEAIDDHNARSLRMPVFAWVKPLAIAASLGLIATVGGVMLLQTERPSLRTEQATPVPATQQPPVAVALAQVTGPHVESLRSDSVATVSIGHPVGLPPSALTTLTISGGSPARVLLVPSGATRDSPRPRSGGVTGQGR